MSCVSTMEACRDDRVPTDLRGNLGGRLGEGGGLLLLLDQRQGLRVAGRAGPAGGGIALQARHRLACMDPGACRHGWRYHKASHSLQRFQKHRHLRSPAMLHAAATGSGGDMRQPGSHEICRSDTETMESRARKFTC